MQASPPRLAGMSSAAGQRLLWGTFAVVSLVCILCAGVCVFKNVQWYEIDLDVPGSMRPFSHNETERVAMRTLWDVHSISIDVDFPVHINKTIPISELSNASMIGAMFNVPASSLFLLQDLQKTSEFFLSLSQLAIGLSVAAFACILGLYLRHCFTRRSAPNSGDGWLIGGDGETASHRPTSVTLFPNGTAVGSYVNPSVWVSQKQVALVIMVLSTVAFLMEFLGALFYAITLKIDSQSLLPTLAKGLKFLCLTHSPESCHIEVQWRLGILMFVSAAVVQFVQAMLILLLCEDDRKIIAALPGSLIQPLLANPV